MRQRLKNFPASSPYQTQVIDYPGGVYSGHNAYVPPNNQIVNNNYQQLPVAPPVPIQQVPIVQSIQAPGAIPFPPPTTTTSKPKKAEPLYIEEIASPIPALRAPVRRVRKPLPISFNFIFSYFSNF